MDLTLIGALIGFAGVITAIVLKVALQPKRRPVPDWTQYWMKKLRSESWVEREEALRQLAHPDCRSAVPKIVRLLNNEKHWDVAAQAVRTLNNIGDPRSIRDLAKAQNHIHPGVRREAAVALGDFGDKTVIPELIQIATHDNDSNVRYNTIVALGKLRAVAAVDILARFAISDEKTSWGESLAKTAESALSLIR